ncbi:auxin-responsive protein SAUR72-like [Canna indica]|uniref:Auxin-responsive protein SAUR72-like n=1 Tax=Canna indica TaxID=4628 RepID=A0AAQ3K666_9LILI|nr:auxin-responsive protein SAUR72-like [Canna indica]
MEIAKEKKGLIVKAFERCRSLARRRGRPSSDVATPRSKPWQRSKSAGGRLRGGCFTVYVGPSKERFVIKMECVSHPLFKVLLDEAEVAYGFASPGPVELPCDVELFHKVMCEIDQEMAAARRSDCGFVRCYSAGSSQYQLLTPSRLIVSGHLI